MHGFTYPSYEVVESAASRADQSRHEPKLSRPEQRCVDHVCPRIGK